MQTYKKDEVTLDINGETINPYIGDDMAQIDALTTGASLNGGCDASVGYYVGGGRVQISIGSQAYNASAAEARRIAKAIIECADMSEVKK